MPKAEGGLISLLQQRRTTWLNRARPPLSLRDISPALRGRSRNRTFAKVSLRVDTESAAHGFHNTTRPACTGLRKQGPAQHRTPPNSCEQALTYSAVGAAPEMRRRQRRGITPARWSDQGSAPTCSSSSIVPSRSDSDVSAKDGGLNSARGTSVGQASTSAATGYSNVSSRK